MADLKISALTSATTPLGGTEVLPVVQSATTKKTAISTIKDYILGLANIFTANQTIQTTASTASKLSVVSELDGSSDYQSNFEVRRTGTAGGARWKSKRSPSLGGVGWVAQVTANNAAEVAATYTDAFAIDNIGDATLYTGNLIQGTAAKGVNFTANTPAAGKTSQLLNWYEEGTWTPTAGVTITSSYAKYTRVGRKVSCICWVSVSANANGSLFTLGGLPFSESSGQGGLGVTGYSTVGALFARQNNPTDLLFVTAGNGNVTNSALSGATFALMYEYFV